MILVTGGARSGKSEFAEKLAETFGNRLLYIATAIPFDTEMTQRILLHQKRRGEKWTTYEGYLNLAEKICQSTDYDCILLDCITILINNLLFYYGRENPKSQAFPELEQKIIFDIKQIIPACDKKNIILVTNEVGFGIVPQTELGRFFRDTAGKVNQILAGAAQEVYFIVSGIPIKIKGDCL